MWPQRGEALSRTIDAEAAVADLYAEALRRWAPDARAAVLPALTASTTLPPDPDAVTQTQTAWNAHAEEVIIAGLLMLWAVTYVEAAAGLGITLALPDLELSGVPAFDKQAVSIIARTTDASAAQVREWAARVQADDGARATVADFIDQQRPAVFATTGAVQHELAAAVRAAEFPSTGGVAGNVDDQRKAAALALEPASPQMRDLARREGYQAAGVMNHAVVAAAEQSPDAGELEKFWLATLDGKTRPTHWAAEGQRVPLAGKFTVGGEQMDHPGDESASPAEWKNCRCRLGILAKDEALPDEVDRHTERLDGRDSVAINRDGRTQAEEIERRRDAGNVRARDDEDGIGRVASGGWTAPSEQEHDMKPSDMAKKIGEGVLTFAAPADTQADETFLTFTDALFAVTGTPTDDRRMLASDIKLTFRDTPMPLQWCEEMEGGHFGSVTVGVIEAIRFKNGEIRGDGYMLNSDNAIKAIDLVSHGVCNPSIDSMFEVVLTYEDGTVVTEDNYDPNKPMFETATSGKVLATTIVAIPAFGQTRIALNEVRETRAKAMVAGAVADFAPRVKTYDPALFADPKLTRPTAPTMNNETGRIYGHLAEWGHTIRGGRDVTPRNHNGYVNFHTSQVQLDNGKQLSVGRLTVQGGHASTSPGVTAATARAHYDNVCTAFGLVRVGEDRWGIWFSGIPAPGVDPETFQAGMTAPLSGDWRDCGTGGIDMIGAHAVNSPGFPIYSAVTGPDGQDVALVASLAPRADGDGGFSHLTLDDVKAAMAEVLAESNRNAAFAQRSAAALERAHRVVGDPPAPLTPTERVTELLATHDLTESFAHSAMPASFKRYWLPGGIGGAEIAWGTPGDFKRCTTAINAKIVEHGRAPLPGPEIDGLCATLHKEATGATPGHAPGEGG